MHNNPFFSSKDHNVTSATPIAMLKLLATTKDVEIRCAVAALETTPPEILAILVKDDDLNVKSAVAANQSTPTKSLAILAEWALIEWAEEKFPIYRSGCDEYALHIYHLLCDLASNRSSPQNVLELLSEVPEVGRIDPSPAACVASNPGISPDLLARLSVSRKESIRRGIAQNPTTPEQILRRYAKCNSIWVRYYVAENLNTPTHVLRQLTQDQNSDVRRAVSKNPNSPAEVSRLRKQTQSNRESKLLIFGPGGGSTETSFGGRPVNPVGEKFKWPSCKSCQGPLQFLGKIAVPQGLLQLFMCQNQPGFCETWEADGGCNKVLVTHGKNLETVSPPEEGETTRGPEYGVVFKQIEFDYSEHTVNAQHERVLGKLHGKPDWIQMDETPSCDKCKRRMQFVAQLEDWGPEPDYDMGFGGGGCGYVFTCSCEQSAKLLWQCG